MNQDLQNYISQSRQAGKTDDQIRQELLGAGWGESQVEEYFGYQFLKPPHSNIVGFLFNYFLGGFFILLEIYLSFYLFNLSDFENIKCDGVGCMVAGSMYLGLFFFSSFISVVGLGIALTVKNYYIRKILLITSLSSLTLAITSFLIHA